jgi:uncharacterized surface protein with fasciclin (FAS1) repeats
MMEVTVRGAGIAERELERCREELKQHREELERHREEREQRRLDEIECYRAEVTVLRARQSASIIQSLFRTLMQVSFNHITPFTELKIGASGLVFRLYKYSAYTVFSACAHP